MDNLDLIRTKKLLMTIAGFEDELKKVREKIDIPKSGFSINKEYVSWLLADSRITRHNREIWSSLALSYEIDIICSKYDLSYGYRSVLAHIIPKSDDLLLLTNKNFSEIEYFHINNERNKNSLEYHLKELDSQGTAYTVIVLPASVKKIGTVKNLLSKIWSSRKKILVNNFQDLIQIDVYSRTNNFRNRYLYELWKTPIQQLEVMLAEKAIPLPSYPEKKEKMVSALIKHKFNTSIKPGTIRHIVNK